MNVPYKMSKGTNCCQRITDYCHLEWSISNNFCNGKSNIYQNVILIILVGINKITNVTISDIRGFPTKTLDISFRLKSASIAFI